MLVTALMTVMTVCCLVGCGAKNEEQKAVSAEVAGNKETQVDSNSAILVVSFGTSFNDSRDMTIGAIENAIAEAMPEYEVRRAFTSQIIIDVLKERDGLEIDNVEQALDKAVTDGIKELIVQPTHLMNGYEYHDLAKTLTDYLDKFDKIVLAEPLLMSDADFDGVIKAMTENTASYDDGETAICFMGHGTEAASNVVYGHLQDQLVAAGHENYYVGTVEGIPTLDDVVAALKAKGIYKKVVLQPLMVVAGDHANNDMAGSEEDSWKSVLEKEGYKVTCVIEGLGQYEAIQNLYVQHLQTAISSGEVFSGIEEDEMTGNAEAVSAGTYDVQVESSSSMFKVEKATVTITDDGSMTAVLTMSGTGYTKLYMGTAENALTASEEDYIAYATDANSTYIFTIPVEALDQPIDVAAYSKKKEEWYDRQLTFLSTTLLAEESATTSEITEDVAMQASTAATGVENGTYTIDLTFEGGSGKAFIQSPATLKMTDGMMMATVQWNSENYDYMLVDGEKYLPISTKGGSIFEMPVSALDTPLLVIGDTVAMSKPKEIEYNITFHSGTMKPVE